jgi:mono/diheme cytochrome c family protein
MMPDIQSYPRICPNKKGRRATNYRLPVTGYRLRFLQPAVHSSILAPLGHLSAKAGWFMKKLLLVLITVIFALTLAGCGKSSNNGPNSNGNQPPSGPLPPKLDPVLDQAKGIYEEKCMICHKNDGTGGRVTINGENLRVPNFKVGHALRHSDKDFQDQIAEGGDGMPAFKDKLTPEQIKDVVAYIRQAFQPGVTPPK